MRGKSRGNAWIRAPSADISIDASPGPLMNSFMSAGSACSARGTSSFTAPSSAIRWFTRSMSFSFMASPPRNHGDHRCTSRQGCRHREALLTLIRPTGERHDRPAAAQIDHQGLHVRPVRHGGGYAVRPGRSRHTVSESQELAGRSQQLRNLVAPHAFRELDDRRVARPRPHPLSRNRRACRRLRDGPRRHRPYAGGRSAPW